VRDFGYAPKDQTPVLRVNNKREGLGFIPTVTKQGQVRWKVFEGAMHADLLIDFFKRLVKDRERKGVPDPRQTEGASRAEGQGMARRARSEIQVFHLPCYSPEPNPGECLNTDLKKAVTRRAPARSKCNPRARRSAIGADCRNRRRRCAATTSTSRCTTLREDI
jgi:hypothetical protein